MPEQGVKHMHRLNEVRTDRAGPLRCCLSLTWARVAGEQRGFGGVHGKRLRMVQG